MSRPESAAFAAPTSARIAAIVTWVYAAGFGVPAIPIAIFAVRKRALPWFLNLFPMYGGQWSNARRWTAFAWLLVAFSILTLGVAIAGVLLWRGRRAGAILTFALIPFEAVFWWGFALPIPPLLGTARVALAAVAWRRLHR